MSYSDFYLARKVASRVGLGRKIWFLKVPRDANVSAAGRDLLGSVVEEKNVFLGKDYPIPFHLTEPKLLLDKLAHNKSDVGLGDVTLTKKESTAGVQLTFNKESGLDFEATASLPGVPFKIDLNLDYGRVYKVELSFGDGSEIEYIPTDFLSRLARYYDGDDSKVDPNLAIDISDNLIVDQIVIAKDYSLSLHSDRKFETGLEVGVEAVNENLGGKIKASINSEYSLKIDVTDGKEYLVGTNLFVHFCEVVSARLSSYPGALIRHHQRRATHGYVAPSSILVNRTRFPPPDRRVCAGNAPHSSVGRYLSMGCHG